MVSLVPWLVGQSGVPCRAGRHGAQTPDVMAFGFPGGEGEGGGGGEVGVVWLWVIFGPRVQ